MGRTWGRLVIEPFDSPLALAAHGTTGKVVAAGVLDTLRRRQGATRADAARRDLTAAWTDEIKLAAAESGIPLVELSATLRSRFGHDTHIDSNLVETNSGGLALTVRGESVEPMTFTSADHSLDTLTVEAAEYIYQKIATGTAERGGPQASPRRDSEACDLRAVPTAAKVGTDELDPCCPFHPNFAIVGAR